METTSSSNVFFTAKNSISDQDKRYGRKTCLCRTHCKLQVSVTTDSVTQPKDKTIASAASDTAVYKVFFYDNLFKLPSPLQMSLPLADLLQRLKYAAYPCLRPKTQQFWEITYLHFLNLSWNGAGLSQSLTNRTRLFRTYGPHNFWDHLQIKVAMGDGNHFLPISSQTSSFSSSQVCWRKDHLPEPPISEQDIRDNKMLFLPYRQSHFSLFCIQRWIHTKQRRGGSQQMKMQVVTGMWEHTRKQVIAGARSGWVGGKTQTQTLPAPSCSHLVPRSPCSQSAPLLCPEETPQHLSIFLITMFNELDNGVSNDKVQQQTTTKPDPVGPLLFPHFCS